ncbi:MAG TPA: copper chaperone PCu(A)C [Casimicrobiaceae bacterium]|nr:copper chaperone PCu(A)C [Casimicrobiaceae bacterium]
MRGLRSFAASKDAAQILARSITLSLTVVVAVALSIGDGAAQTRDYALHDLRIEHPYAIATPPGARTGGAYFTIHNGGASADRLVHVASPVAKSAEVHSMTMDGNVMRMRAVPALDIPAGASVALRPGGYHVMLMGLAHPLIRGASVPLTLTFEKAGTIDVVADVSDAQGHSH